MNEQQNIQQTQLDPKASALTKAIGLQENGGQQPTEQSYLNQGKSGERGLYQFMKPTWNKYAGEILGNPNSDPTPENQNKVVYGKVKQWQDKGFTSEQIASMWNAGEGAPDAYLKGLSGATSTGVKYDVKSYADNVDNYYHQQLKDVNVKEQQQQPTSFLKKVVDFAFPIISDISEVSKGTSKKTGLQLLGDLGLSALWFIPGIGVGAEAGIRGAGILGKVGAKVAGQAIGGATTGYAADVASKLAGGETEAKKVLTPGLGTATGGALGGILGKVAGKYSQEGVLKSITKSNNSILGQTKKGATELAESFAEGKNTGELLAHKGINLGSMVNPETIAFETAEKANQLRKDAGNLNSVLSEALQKVPGTASISELENSIGRKIETFYTDKITASEAKSVMVNELNAVRNQYGELLSASDLNDLKHRAWNLSKFDTATSNLTRKTYRVIGNSLKTEIENMAEKGGLDGVKEMNEYMGSHFDAADALERLNGMKAKGGRLGDLLQKTALTPIGAGIGSMFGGGVAGAILGAMAGGWTSGRISNLLRKIASSPLKNSILNKMVQEDPQIVQKILEYAKQTPQGLEAITEQLKKMGVNIFNPKFSEQISPLKTPQVSKKGILPQLLKTSAIRASIPTQ